jgi:IMP cyclohydrolase
VQNPIGPYPGRQLFSGLTSEGNPCLVYLVTGRSPESRERKAIQMGARVAIGPLGAMAYDPLRHYTAVMSDNSTGIAAVTNGIQTEAIFETYRLLYNVKTQPTKEYLRTIMEGAAAEPDSLHTPRIGAIITSGEGKSISFLSIKRHDRPALAFDVRMQKGRVTGIAVYSGPMETPGPFDPDSGLPELELKGTGALDVARFLFDSSAAANKGQDIRVCTVGAVLKSGAWDVAIVNAH